jgi:hypothetical protein
LPWWLFLVLAALFYLLSLGYQSLAAWRETYERRQQVYLLEDQDLPYPLRLQIDYPQTVPLARDAEQGRQLAVWLWAEPQGPHQAGVVGTLLLSYTLALDPQNSDVLFTDKDGMLTTLTSKGSVTVAPGTPVIYFLRARRGDTGPQQPVHLNVWITDGNRQLVSRLETEIPLEVERGATAWARRFSGLCLGPATPLLVIAGTLIGFAWGQYQWERGEKAKQRTEVEQVRDKLSQDVAAAVREYQALRRKAQNEHWYGESHEQLNSLGATIERRGRRRLLEHALESLGGGQCYKAQDYLRALSGVLRERDVPGYTGPDMTELTLVCGLLVARKNDSANWWTAGGMDAGGAVALLWEVIQYDGYRLRDTLRPLLEALASEPGAVEAIRDEISASPSGREFLRAANFESPLERLLENGGVKPTVRAAAREILSRFRDQPDWPSVWPTDNRPPEPELVKDWLGQAGLAFNPFGPEMAEMDPRLPEIWVDRDPQGKAKRPVVTLVSGEAGAGRSAMALMLTHQLQEERVLLSPWGQGPPEESRVLSVYYRPPATGPAHPEQGQLQALARAIARECVQRMAVEPSIFLGLSSRAQAVLAHFLRASLGPWLQIESIVRLAVLREKDLASTVPEREVAYLLQTLKACCPADVVAPADLLAWFDLFQGVRLKNHGGIYALADWNRSGTDDPANLLGARALLGVASHLASLGIYVKVFVPGVLASDLRDPAGGERMKLEWEEKELIAMLQRRFERASGHRRTIQSLMPPAYGGDVEEQFARAALREVGPPRCLLRLGNALLKKHVSGIKEGTEPTLRFAPGTVRSILGDSARLCAPPVQARELSPEDAVE